MTKTTVPKTRAYELYEAIVDHHADIQHFCRLARCEPEVNKDLKQIVAEQNKMATEMEFTYLLGAIKVALRPRVITADQIAALSAYGQKLWADCLLLEKMWRAGDLDEIVRIETEELDIARLQPWLGSAAIIASDGLFNFGAAPPI